MGANDVVVNLIGRDEASQNFKQAGRNISETAFGIENAFKRLTSITVATLAIRKLTMEINESLQEFVQFQSGIAKIATQVDDTRPIFGKMSDAIERLSVEFGKSTKELTNAGYDIVSSGLTDVTQAIDILSASAKLAAGTFTELDAATSAVLTLMTTTKGQFKTAADAADYLATVGRVARTEVQFLASNIGKVAAIAADTGVDMDVLGAIFATVQDSAQSTEEVFVAVRAALLAIKNPAVEAAKLFKENGIAYGDAALEGDNFFKTIQKLTKISGESKDKIFDNNRAYVAFAGVANNLEGTIRRLVDIRNREGEADRQLAVIKETLAFKQNVLTASIQQFQRHLGEALSVKFSEFLTGITKEVQNADPWINVIAESFNSWALVTEQMVPVFKSLGLVLVVVITTFGEMPIVLSTAVQGLKITLSSFLSFISEVSKSVPGLKKFGTVLQEELVLEFEQALKTIDKNDEQLKKLQSTYNQFLLTLNKADATQIKYLKTTQQLKEEIAALNNKSIEYQATLADIKKRLEGLHVTTAQFKSAFADLFGKSIQDVNDFNEAIDEFKKALNAAFFEQLSEKFIEFISLLIGIDVLLEAIGKKLELTAFAKFLGKGGIIGALFGLKKQKDPMGKDLSKAKEKEAKQSEKVADKLDDVAGNLDKFAKSKDKAIDNLDNLGKGGGSGFNRLDLSNKNNVLSKDTIAPKIEFGAGFGVGGFGEQAMDSRIKDAMQAVASKESGGVLKNIEPVNSEALDSLTKLGSGLTFAVGESKSLNKQILEVGKNFITQAVQYVAAQGIMLAASLASLAILVAAGVVAAYVLALAWLPAALLASVATFGGAAAAGAAALKAAAQSTQGLAKVNISGGISAAGSIASMSGGNAKFTDASVPKMAEGGIVTRPTLALIGEAGPEAVVPLDGSGGIGGMNIHIKIEHAEITDPANLNNLARAISRQIGLQLDRPGYIGARV